MAWRAASKRESERRRQQDAKSQDCNCDWIVGRNSKHLGHLWPRPSATIPMFGTRGPQDAQVGLLDPLAFDSVAHANWSGTEAFRRACGTLCAIGQGAGVGMDCRPSSLGARTDI